MTGSGFRRAARRGALFVYDYVLRPLAPSLGRLAHRMAPLLALVLVLGLVAAIAYTRGRSDAYANIAAARATALAPSEAAMEIVEGDDTVRIAWLPKTMDRWIETVEKASREHGVAADLIAIVMLVESGGNPEARSPSGAVGLMQVMPATGEYIARARGLGSFTLDEPETNIDFGAWYLAQQLGSFGVPTDGPEWHESVDRAAVAYNAGPGHIKAHLDTGRALYAEAARYREWVGGMWRERAEEGSDTYLRWWAAGGRRLVEEAEAGRAQQQPDLRLIARDR